MIEDMVHHLRKIEIRSNLSNFVLPWFYNMKIFKGDSVAMSEAWQNETMKDTEMRLNDLEKKIESSHNKLVLELRSWSSQLVSMLPPPQVQRNLQVPQNPQSYSAALGSPNEVMITNGAPSLPALHWPPLPFSGQNSSSF